MHRNSTPVQLEEPRTLEKEVENIRSEANDLANQCESNSNLFSTVHYGVGVPAVIFTAVGGGVAIANSAPVVAGALALTGTVLTSVQTFVHADRRRVGSRVLAADCRELADDARIALTHYFPHMNEEQRRDRMEELRSRYESIERRYATAAAEQ